MHQLADAYTPCDTRFRPEESPFSTLFVDITHRCNMECHNCYIPVRELPDMPADWLYEILGRLPRRTPRTRRLAFPWKRGTLTITS